MPGPELVVIQINEVRPDWVSLVKDETEKTLNADAMYQPLFKLHIWLAP